MTLKGKFTRIDVESDVDEMSIKEFIPNCPLHLIRPNPWNPNEQDDFQREKTKKSLQNNGFVQALVVREIWKNGKFLYFELLDGEHRTDAAQELGYESAPVNNLGQIPDSKARKLSLILAANRGELNPNKLSKLITELEKELDDVEFEEIPFDDTELEKLKSYYDVSWQEVDVSEIFKKTEELRKKPGVLSDYHRVIVLIPRHEREKITTMFDKYSVDNNISAERADIRRGKIIMHAFYNRVYPEIGREDGVEDGN